MKHVGECHTFETLKTSNQEDIMIHEVRAAPTQSGNSDSSLGLYFAKMVVSLTDIHCLVINPQAWQREEREHTFRHLIYRLDACICPLTRAYCWCVDLPCSVSHCHECGACWKGQVRPLSSRWPAVQGGLGRDTPGSHWSRCPPPRLRVPGWTWVRLQGSRLEMAEVKIWNIWFGFHRQSSCPSCELGQFTMDLSEDHMSQTVDICSVYGYGFHLKLVKCRHTPTSHIQRDFPRGCASAIDCYTCVNSSIHIQALLDCQCAL